MCEQYQPTQHVPPITHAYVGHDTEALYCRDCHRTWTVLHAAHGDFMEDTGPGSRDPCEHVVRATWLPPYFLQVFGWGHEYGLRP